jgi:hypothetical protein
MQSTISLLSLPWHANETSALDFDLWKDKSLKTLSQNLLKSTTDDDLVEIRCFAMSLMCFLPKASPYTQWRVNIITKCLKDDKYERVRQATIKYLPYLIYNLGVTSNALVFQLIHPTMLNEKSLNVLKDYVNVLRTICCINSRKCFMYRKDRQYLDYQLHPSSLVSYERDLDLNSTLFAHDILENHFHLYCACCDKAFVDANILPGFKKEKNLNLIQTLINRPKVVDPNILICFFKHFNGDLANAEPTCACLIKSRLLHYTERLLNHLEFPRTLDMKTLNDSYGNPILISPISPSAATSLSTSNTNPNLTYLYTEVLGLLSNETIMFPMRANCARFTIPKLIHHTQSQQCQNNVQNPGDHFVQNEFKHDHNLHLEYKLCQGFLNAKEKDLKDCKDPSVRDSSNSLNQYLYIVSLGYLATSLNYDEYLFVTVKHLIEIFDSSHVISSALAQRQLFILSKCLNMQELLSEFTEKFCEIISETIFNSIYRKVADQTSTCTYLQDANFSLKDTLKVFNVNDSWLFIRTYQKYLLAYLIGKATDDNYDTIIKSIEFLARKINTTNEKLVAENFPYVFTYINLKETRVDANKPTRIVIFKRILHESALDLECLIRLNQQRLFNELLSRCGNMRQRSRVWQAFHLINSISADTIPLTNKTNMGEDAYVAKIIEPNFLAALVHFDMCLMRSSINVKEKCQVLESLNVLIAMLGANIITKVRYKIMTTLKLAMQQCSKYSELNCKLWDTFVRNVDKSALGPILNQIAVNCLELLDMQPYKVSKIFEYLIVQNSEHLQAYFDELYFIPEQNALQQINQILYKYIDVNYILEKKSNEKKQECSVAKNIVALPQQQQQQQQQMNSINDSQLKVLVNIIKHYLKGKN